MKEQVISEMHIPTPYGRLAAKVWGRASARALNVLAVHGWQDNAATFDTLLPLLDVAHLHVVAVDLPGHGLSSHLPNGVPYTDITWVLEMKRVVDHLKWTRLSIIAHSMGANASIHFAVLFPELVDRVITIDTVKPAVFAVNELADRTRQDILNFKKLEENNKRNENNKSAEMAFPYERALQTLIVAHSAIGAITRDGAACLLKRATKVTPNGYVFTRDYRLQVVLNRKMDAQSLLQYFSGIRCELLIINGKEGLFTDRELQKQFLDLYAQKCSKFCYIEVDGDHYIHLSKPFNVAPHINQFLSEPIEQLNIL